MPGHLPVKHFLPLVCVSVITAFSAMPARKITRLKHVEQHRFLMAAVSHKCFSHLSPVFALSLGLRANRSDKTQA